MKKLEFNDLTINEYVGYNNHLTFDWSALLDIIWADEPMDCIFQVIRRERGYGHKPDMVELSCVKDCGGHDPDMLVITEDEYENICMTLGDNLFVGVDFSELAAALSGKQGYDFEDDINEVEALIATGNLPKNRKYTA